MSLLREAGWQDTDGDGVLDKVIDGQKTPFRFEFKIPSGSSTGKSVILVLQEELKRHGIIATVRDLDWTIFLDDVKNHKFDAVIMARIATITKKEDLAPQDQKVYDAIAQSRGVVGGPWLALLHSPELTQRTMHLGSYIRFESTLDHKVVEFTALVAARELDCKHAARASAH